MYADASAQRHCETVTCEDKEANLKCDAILNTDVYLYCFTKTYVTLNLKYSQRHRFRGDCSPCER